MNITTYTEENLVKLLGVARRIYFWGPPGVGKTYIAREAFDKIGLESWVISLDEDRMVQEMLGHYIPEGTKFVWHDGPLALAIRSGGLIVNEVPRGSGAVKDLMLSVLDNPASFSIALPTGERLTPHDKFAVIMTGNQSPLNARLDEAFIDRIDIVCHIPEPTPGVVAYLNHRRKSLGDAILASYGDSDNSISPRKAITIADLMDSLNLKALEGSQLVLGESAGKSFIALLDRHRQPLEDVHDLRAAPEFLEQVADGDEWRVHAGSGRSARGPRPDARAILDLLRRVDEHDIAHLARPSPMPRRPSASGCTVTAVRFARPSTRRQTQVAPSRSMTAPAGTAATACAPPGPSPGPKNLTFTPMSGRIRGSRASMPIRTRTVAFWRSAVGTIAMTLAAMRQSG